MQCFFFVPTPVEINSIQAIIADAITLNCLCLHSVCLGNDAFACRDHGYQDLRQSPGFLAVLPGLWLVRFVTLAPVRFRLFFSSGRLSVPIPSLQSRGNKNDKSLALRMVYMR